MQVAMPVAYQNPEMLQLLVDMQDLRAQYLLVGCPPSILKELLEA